MAYSYVWPTTLPQIPMLAGYAETPGLVVDTFPMDAGVSRTQFAGIAPDVIPVSMTMTGAQLTALRAFVYDDLRGTSRFGFPHPRTKAMIEARFVPDGDRKVYQLQALGGDVWRVTFTLWVLP